MKIRGESGGMPARGGGGRGSGKSGGGRVSAPPKENGNPSQRGKLGVSTRTSELDKGTKRVVKKQNKAADSYKIKDLDQLEKGRAYRADRKAIAEAKRIKDLKEAERKGKIKGAVATVAVGAGALAVADNEKKKAKAKPTPSAKPGSKKLTPDQAKLAKAVQRISSIDRKKK